MTYHMEVIDTLTGDHCSLVAKSATIEGVFEALREQAGDADCELGSVLSTHDTPEAFTFVLRHPGVDAHGSYRYTQVGFVAK